MRLKPGVREQAAAAALASDGSEAALDAIAKKAGIKSRRTLDGWIARAQAAAADADDDPPEPAVPPASDGPSAAADRRQEGDAEVVLAVLRCGVTLSTRSAAMLFGVDLQHPALRDVAKLSTEEEETVRAFAPSLLPALDGLTKYVKKHGALVFAMLLAGMTLPRVALLARAGKQAKKAADLTAQLLEVQRTRAATRSSAGAGGQGGGGGGGFPNLSVLPPPPTAAGDAPLSGPTP
jgi:transposase-like protein